MAIPVNKDLLMDNHRKAFNDQKNNAARRGIDFDFDFDEWLNFWKASGKLDRRGVGSGKYVMARKNDTGPYSVGNCYITESLSNLNEPQVQEKRSAAQTGDNGRKHLKNRNDHPRGKMCMSPRGMIFPSASLAADEFGVERQTIAARCRNGTFGWCYITDDYSNSGTEQKQKL